MFAHGISATDARALQQGTRAAPWRELTPPAPIAGLPDATPAATPELSRAWLARVSEVRDRREALTAAGELDGLSPLAAAARGAALTGVLRIPVIPVRYADVPEPFPIDRLERRLFGASVGDTVSYADYWTEVSGGLLRVEGEIAPWVTLRSSANHYLPPHRYGWAQFGRIGEVRAEALRAADAALDYRRFDNDGPDGIPDSGDDDGFVDFVAFVYALPCPGDGRTGAIWPHRAAMPAVETADTAVGGQPIRVADYVILPAVDIESCGAMHVGLLAHETGHALGLPDLYDYDGSSFGIGDWGLMGTGSHGRLHSPAHLSAWEKEQLGWVRVSWLERDSALVHFAPVERDRTVYRYDARDGSGRYLLLENRQRIGSDKELPGQGLLVWEVDPEPGELGVWNRDERRTAVGLARGGTAAAPRRHRDRADPRDPLPGLAGRRDFRWDPYVDFSLSSIGERGDLVSARVGLRWSAAPLRVEPAVLHFAAIADGEPARQTVMLLNEGPSFGVTPCDASPWITTERQGEALIVSANPAGLAPGVHTDTLHLIDATGATAATVLVVLDVAPRGVSQVVATELPWGWGLAARSGSILQASYGRDPLDARPRPRVLELLDGRSHPITLARLPADAVYAPVAADDHGGAFVLARADDRNLVYRIAGGEAELVAADIGDAPTYGATRTHDGHLLVAEWTGQIHRVQADGTTALYTQLNERIYQLAADTAGNVFVATLRGEVVRIGPDGTLTYLQTGFGHGRLVAIAASDDGRVYAAERGGEGRIVRFDPDGRRELLFREPGSEFYGLALDGGFLYALDLTERRMLRLPVAATAPRTRIAAQPQGN